MSVLDSLCVGAERSTITVLGTQLFFPNEITLKALQDAYAGIGDDIRTAYAKMVVFMAEDEAGAKLFAPTDWKPLLDRGKVELRDLFQFIEQLYVIPLGKKLDDKQRELQGNQ